MDPYQMQTPPPTRDASSRRKMLPPQMGISSTPSTLAPHPIGTPMGSHLTQPPQGPQGLNIQTPFQYHTLQFSPENFQFPGGGPASAPVYPQSRLFWDPNSPNNAAGIDMGASLNDPFGPSPQVSHGLPVWPTFDQQARPTTAPFNPSSQPQMQTNQHLWSPGDVLPQNVAPFPQSSQPPATTGVNPNMLASFSSPAPHNSITIQPQQTQISHPQGMRQPYEHQMEESKREQDIARRVKQQHSRPTSSSANVPSLNAKPGLHRSNTDSGFRRKQNQSVDSRLSTQSNEQAIPRKPSPLKRHSQQGPVSLTAIPEAVRTRPRTRLVIGEDGRARTETEPAEDDVDNRPHSRLWATIDSDSESEAEDAVPSQRSSFIFSSDSFRRSSKHARIDSTAEPAKVTRSSSSGSLSNLSLGIRRSASSSSRRSHTKIDPRRFSIASFGAGSFTSDGAERNSGTWEMEGVEEGDAQLALKKVVEDRHRRQEQTSPEAILKAHNQRWSLASTDAAKLQPFVIDPPTSTPSGSTSSYHMHHTISPSAFTDAGMNNLTPQTDRTSLSQENIRCLCNIPEDDGTQMIQCESCIKWLHVRCVGLNSHNLPPVFVCVYCTGHTPLVRGGRVREPMRIMPQQQQNFASPLAGRGRNPFG
ncbi:hypothetical protein NA57DRAFT_70381 [Rhizodiscina lignyota]|uniref:Zinc finger PHD-type domain-containing protein n=1 Tax=Rhizodiscina lignyota TaxID=1504668 RepID=A0A9P4IMB2_9PEZI|nr:hypothetical protein NA57DRAFT_70381 [Rhizodiscina lignyota]